MIKVYSLNTCAPCKTVKYLLKMKNKDFQEIDCTDSNELRDEAFKISGSTTMPVVIIGDNIVSGGNIPRIVSLI